MFVFEIFRSFLPVHNPIGFGAADFIEFAIAIGLVAIALIWRPWLLPLLERLSQKPIWSMLFLGSIPVILRIGLIASFPTPAPKVADDFSYLLLADTFRHLRMANTMHPLHQFFETFFVLQQPTYSSIFPPGQGILIGIFWLIFGLPWAGVAFSIAALSALTYWMLRGWVTPRSAFLGGLLAGLMFGPLSQWMNSFWGGALSAIAGCLVYGALPRLTRGGRFAVVLGVGLSLQLLTRPFEFLFLAASVLVYLLMQHRFVWKQSAIVLCCLLPATAFIVTYNHAVTGAWLTLPYQVSRFQYGVPAAFTFEPNPIPHRELTAGQQLDYEMQAQVHDSGLETSLPFLSRLVTRIRFYRFFCLAPFYCAFLSFVLTLRELRSRFILTSVLLFAIGTDFYPYFYAHYIAALTSLFILALAVGLVRSGPVFSRVIVYVAAFHFVFWYGVHLADIQPLQRFATWVNIDHPNPEGRTKIEQQLRAASGKQLVFVRYGPRHDFQEWVYNFAEIDKQTIVWARDVGPLENEKLRRYYGDRTAWLLEPDYQPPNLSSYDVRPLPAMEQVP